jgi:hypothetical protein
MNSVRRRAGWGVARWLLACGWALACAGPATHERPKIVLVGVDGFEWSVALPLVVAGRMPELALLMERGSYGYLPTVEPTVSPVIWTSIATGKTARKHGIFGFDMPDGDGRRLYTNLDRRPKAFWNVLSDFGRRVHVVGWWLTHPVEPIDGVMVAQTNTLRGGDVQKGGAVRKGSLIAGVAGQVHPPAREAEIFAMLDAVEARFAGHLRAILGQEEPTGSPVLERIWNASLWSLRADALYADVAERLAGEGDFELLAVYLGGTDVLGHRLWRHYDPKSFTHPPSEAEVRRYGGILPAYYEFVDRAIGRLRRAAGDSATLIVVSDHGMRPYRTDFAFDAKSVDLGPADLISGGHDDAPAGIFAAAGPGIRDADDRAAATLSLADLRPVGHVYGVAATLYALLDLPAAADMDGAAIREVLEDRVLDAWKAAPVASHDDTEWFAARLQAKRVQVDESERMQQLRELGYIE